MKLNIGENIKKLRAQKNVTQEELAGYLGVSYQAVSRWETGQCYPDIELLPEISRFFEVKMEELMGTEQIREKINAVVCKMSEVQFTDSRTALDTLHELQKEFPNDWQIKEGICSALLEEGKEDYDKVIPEMHRYGWEARLKFDKEDVWNTQLLYRSMVLAAPEEEAEEWADQLVSHLYNTKSDNMLLRYTDFRKDVDKARYWQGRAIWEYTDALSSQFRNPAQTKEGWINARRMNIRLYDAVAGIPYEENGVVHNTLFLKERIRNCITLVLETARAGQKETALQALEKAVDYLLLYADSLKQDRLTSDNPYFDFSERDIIPDNQYDYMIHDKEYSLLDYAMKMETGPGWISCLTCIRDTEEYRTQIERLRAKKLEVDELYKEELSALKNK